MLRHETPLGSARGTHLDLMLEQGAALRTWALTELPAEDKIVVAERLPDHRPLYLDYEGEVSGGRGTVSRIDHGEYHVVEDSAQWLVIKIAGFKLRGTLTIEQDEAAHRWRVSLSTG